MGKTAPASVGIKRGIRLVIVNDFKRTFLNCWHHASARSSKPFQPEAQVHLILLLQA
uniref:Uncharacterized protein n=1 Tax=Solanum tuberosum TaxID=4113 RepID=M1D1Q2_SOLTU